VSDGFGPAARIATWLRAFAVATWLQVRARESRALLVLGIVQPATFLAITLLARRGGSTPAPATVALGVGLAALWGTTIWQSGTILRIERWQGTLPMVVMRPAGLAPVLIGKSLGETLLAAVLITATVSVGSAAAGGPIAVAHVPEFAAAVVAVFVSATVLGLLLSCVFVLTRAATRISEALVYPVFVLGGLIVPLSLLPSFVRPASWVVSLRWGGELLRAAQRGDPQSLRAWLLLGLTTATYAAVAHVAYGRVLERVRRKGTLDVL
jgi:ABC-2 type transport system permease protein